MHLVADGRRPRGTEGHDGSLAHADVRECARAGTFDPLDATASIFRTETRVVTTDPDARAKFRRYWAFASPGIILIRWASLGPLKAEAERRGRAETRDPPP